MRFSSAILGVLVPVGDASDGDLVETADPAIRDIAVDVVECGPDAVGDDPAVDAEAVAASVAAALFVAARAPVSGLRICFKFISSSLS